MRLEQFNNWNKTKKYNISTEDNNNNNNNCNEKEIPAEISMPFTLDYSSWVESKLSHSWKSTRDQFLLVTILIVFSVILGFVCSPNEMVGIA